MSNDAPVTVAVIRVVKPGCMEAKGCWTGRRRAAIRTAERIGNLVHAPGPTGHRTPAPLENGYHDVGGGLPSKLAVRCHRGKVDQELVNIHKLGHDWSVDGHPAHVDFDAVDSATL